MELKQVKKNVRQNQIELHGEIGESTRIMGDFNNYQKWIDMTGIKSGNRVIINYYITF